MIPAILFIGSVLAGIAACIATLFAPIPALILFLISAVLFVGAAIVASIVDLEKAVKAKGNPPPLPR